MSYQLIYTSAERGLKSGSRGFTTVAMTEGMPAHCLQLCETMSGYVHVFELNSDLYVQNPVAWSHYRVKCGAVWYSLVSRVSAHAKDYTGRTNKIAHHLMLEQPQETYAYANGPEDLLESSFFTTQWSGDPKFLPMGQQPPATREHFDPQAKRWLAAGLPTEGAASIAGALLQGTESPIVLLYDPADSSQNALGLIQDILELLPPGRKWEIGFSSYYSMHPSGSEVHIRACAKGTDAARRAARHPRAVVVDMDQAEIQGLQHLPPVEQDLINAAATGALPAWAIRIEPSVETIPVAQNDEYANSRPPPRPDRPGMRRVTSLPPVPGKRPPLPTQEKKLAMPILIGVGVGMLMLLFVVGLKVKTRTPPVQQGEKQPGTTESTTTADVSEDITHGETSNPQDVEAPSTINPDEVSSDTQDEEKGENTSDKKDAIEKTEDTTERVELEVGVNQGSATDDKNLESTGSTKFGKVKLTPEEEQNSENKTVLLRMETPWDISELKGIKSWVLIDSTGKKSNKSLSERSGKIFYDGIIVEDNKLTKSHLGSIAFLEAPNDVKSTIYYQQGENALTLNRPLVDNVIKLDSALVEMLSKIKDQLQTEFYGQSQKFEFQGEMLKLPGLNDRINQIQIKINEDYKDKVLARYKNYLSEFKSIKIKEANPPKNIKEFENFQKQQNEKIHSLIKDVFLVKQNEDPDPNPFAIAFTSVVDDQNCFRAKLNNELKDKEIEKNLITQYRSTKRNKGFEDNIITLYNESLGKTGRGIWIDAAIEAIQEAKDAKITEVEKFLPISFQKILTFKVKDADTEDTLLIINLETTP